MLSIKLLRLVTPLLFLGFFLFLDSVFINYFLQSINEKSFGLFLFSIISGLLFISITLEQFGYIVEEYESITKNNFLNTYVFPKELSKILSERYPHLKKSEVEEVLEVMKAFYRFQINKDTSIPRYMPSRVVDFAYQTFFDMPKSSLFFKKLLSSHNKYHRVLAEGTMVSKKLIRVLLAGQYSESINDKISEMWCYCCKEEGIDPFFPLSFPSFFTLDKRLNIPSGFIYELDETPFREIHPISKALDIADLRKEVKEVKDRNYLAKKIQYYLGCYGYCHQYQREELEELFKLIDKNHPLAHAVYGQYSDVNFFITTALDSAAPPPKDDVGGGCSSSGASV